MTFTGACLTFDVMRTKYYILLLALPICFLLGYQQGSRSTHAERTASGAADELLPVGSLTASIQDQTPAPSDDFPYLTSINESALPVDISLAHRPGVPSKVLEIALTAGTPTERKVNSAFVLESINRDNWYGLWERYVNNTLESGRTHDGDASWGIFMNRIGEVAGEDAMAFFESNAQPEHTFNRREILEGWAASKPEEALKWMRAQAPDGINKGLWPALIRGAAQGDVEKALDFASEAPEKYRGGIGGTLASATIQSRGFEYTANMFWETVELRGADESYHQFIKEFHSVLNSRVNRMNWLRSAFPDDDYPEVPYFDDIETILTEE